MTVTTVTVTTVTVATVTVTIAVVTTVTVTTVTVATVTVTVTTVTVTTPLQLRLQFLNQPRRFRIAEFESEQMFGDIQTVLPHRAFAGFC